VEEKKNKKPNWLEKHWAKLLYLILPAVGMFAWDTTKDIFTTGTETKTTALVVNITTTDKDIDSHFRGIVKEELHKALKDPTIWYDVLGSDFIMSYADSKIDGVMVEIDKKIAAVDSAQHNLINSIGKISGLRNDQFEDVLARMMRWFVSNHLEPVSHSF
jgi:hypothetical protein